MKLSIHIVGKASAISNSKAPVCFLLLKFTVISFNSGDNISDDDYRHAVKVWKTFNCETLEDYTLLCMELDVRILADVFEEFCENSLKTYQLDPAHYFAAPGLSWDAMLKCTGVELELLDDIDMVLFIERGIRGGISQCCNRYAKANTKYMDDYDEQ